MFSARQRIICSFLQEAHMETKKKDTRVTKADLKTRKNPYTGITGYDSDNNIHIIGSKAPGSSKSVFEEYQP